MVVSGGPWQIELGEQQLHVRGTREAREDAHEDQSAAGSDVAGCLMGEGEAGADGERLVCREDRGWLDAAVEEGPRFGRSGGLLDMGVSFEQVVEVGVKVVVEVCFVECEDDDQRFGFLVLGWHRVGS